MKTREEVNALKLSWLKNPCWDIQDTGGFEEYGVELAGFAIEHEKEWKYAREKCEALELRNMPAIDATLRDVFAGQAIQGMLAHSRGNPPHGYKPIDSSRDWHEAIAEEAYMLADAMMAAREKGKAK